MNETKPETEPLAVGDEVTVWATGSPDKILWIDRITRTTATQYVTGCGDRFMRPGGNGVSGYKWIAKTTDADRAAVVERLAAKAAAEQAAREYSAREDVQLARRVGRAFWIGGETEALALGVDKLRRIAAILDEPDGMDE